MSGGRSAPWLVVLALFLALTGQSCCSSPLPRWQAASEGIPVQVGIAAGAVAPGERISAGGGRRRRHRRRGQ